MSTSQNNSITNIKLSEEQLILTTVLSLVFCTVPLLIENSFLLAALLLFGLVSSISVAKFAAKSYTKRAQSRIVFGGTLLSVASVIIAFSTTFITGVVFFITSSIFVSVQLFLKLR